MRMGVTLPLEGLQDRKLLELAQQAERLGYSDGWSLESYSTDGFSPLAAAAAVTQKLRLGTAIIPASTRPPALIAMSAATVQQISGGRFTLGLGISTPTIVERWMGVPFKQPVTRLRETVEVLREIFSGKKVSCTKKTFSIDGFRLDVRMDSPPPIYLAAQGPKMLNLVGAIADGLITNFVTIDTLPKMLAEVRKGANTAGRGNFNFEVVCRIVVVVDEDVDETAQLLKRSLVPYVTAPAYNRFFRWIDFEEEAQTALEAWEKGDRTRAVKAISDRMVNAIYVFGDASTCRARLADYGKAGVTVAVLQLTSFAPTVEQRTARILRALELLAPGQR